MYPALMIAALVTLTTPNPDRYTPPLHYRSAVELRVIRDLARFHADDAYCYRNHAIRYRAWEWEKLRMGPTAAIIYADEIAVANWTFKAWDALYDARAHSHMPAVAAGHLDHLRGLLGDWCYERGLMPLACPPWVPPFGGYGP